VGAIFSVTIANIKNISEFISIKSLKISLLMLTFSFVFSGIQKILSLLLRGELWGRWFLECFFA
jgi:hypothetical protein